MFRFERFTPMKLKYCILFLLFPCFNYGQIVLNGSLIDKTTKQPLPFANISLVKATYGTSSNDNGVFQLRVDSADIDDSLLVQYIGYSSFKMSIRKAQKKGELKIKMTPKGIELSEVLVRLQPPTYYIKQAVNKRHLNYAEEAFSAQAYYRQKFYENGKPINMQEAVFQSYYPQYNDTSSKNQHSILLHREPSQYNNLEFYKEKMEKREAKIKKREERKGREYEEQDIKQAIADLFTGPEDLLEDDLMHEIDSYLDSANFKKYNYWYENPQLLMEERSW